MNLIALGWRLFINSLAQSIVAKKPTVTFDAMLNKQQAYITKPQIQKGQFKPPLIYGTIEQHN